MSDLANNTLASSSDTVSLVRRPAKGKEALSCWMALPCKLAPDAVPLVAVHGVQRGAKQQASLLAAQAALLGRPVIAPLFSEKRWPQYQQVVRGKRADLALLRLMNELRLAGIWQSQQFELSGYSGGAQFAHRFALLYPQIVARLTVASAGWYSFPDEAPFPYGMAPRPGRSGDWGPRLAAGLERFLRIPIHVCVGSKDCVADAKTRRGEQIDEQQGDNRMMRAKRWVLALQRCAAAKGIESQISFSVLPECGHDFRECVEVGGLDRVIFRTESSSGVDMPRAHHWDRETGPAAAPQV